MMRAMKSTRHAARAWGVSVRTVTRLASAGSFRAVKIGRQILIPVDEIARVAREGAPVRANAK